MAVSTHKTWSALLATLVLLGAMVFAVADSGAQSVAQTDTEQPEGEPEPTPDPAAPGPNGECPEGSYLSDQNRCTTLFGCPPGQIRGIETECIKDPALEQAEEAEKSASERTPEDCAEGEYLSEDGRCITFSGCALDETRDDQGECKKDPAKAAPAEPTNTCDAGFELGADGETCISSGADCPRGEVAGDDGVCVKARQCDAGMVLAADLLTCKSGGCPEGELLAVDGSRCIAPDSTCPDGSPRPISGTCLVVDKCEQDCEEGEVRVRCASEDLFCQALVKQCAEDRAAGTADGEGNCADPRGNCADGDDECTQANDRLIECSLEREEVGEEVTRIESCDKLCPRLHTLDAAGECIEYLDPTHPCVSFGVVPSGITTNDQLNAYSFLAGTGQCVTRTEFLRRLGNFEAAAGAEADAIALLRKTTSAYLTVEEQIEGLETELDKSRVQVVDLRDDAADADLRRADKQEELGETRVELAAQREILKKEAVEFFVSGGDETAVAMAVLNAKNIDDVGKSLTYGRLVLQDQVKTIDRVAALEVATELQAEELKASVVEAREAVSSALSAKTDLETLLTDVQQLREDQLERRNQEAEIVSDLRADKAAYARELGVFEQASREIADIIAESEFLVSNFDDFDGLLAQPVNPVQIVSRFGPRLHPILGYVRPHNGLDFDGNFGEPIYASAPGIVQIASTFGGYGETVVLDHGGGLLTLYAHMSVINADVGEQIERGDIIGAVGSTGLSTGPHLHFEVWVNGSTAVDPLPYLTGSGG